MVAPRRRAASAGSANWCLGAMVRRDSSLAPWTQAGTGSISHMASSASRWRSTVVLAGFSALPAVAASRIFSYDVVEDTAAA